VPKARTSGAGRHF